MPRAILGRLKIADVKATRARVTRERSKRMMSVRSSECFGVYFDVNFAL